MNPSSPYLPPVIPILACYPLVNLSALALEYNMRLHGFKSHIAIPPPPLGRTSRQHSELIWFTLQCGKAKQCTLPPILVLPRPLSFPSPGWGTVAW